MNKEQQINQKKIKSLEKINDLIKEDDIDKAVKKYSKLYKAYPTDPKVVLSYGKFLIFNEKTRQKGIKLLQGLTFSADALNVLKAVAIEDKNYELAAEYCKKSLSIVKDAKNYNYRLYDLANIYKKMNNFEISNMYFKKLLDTTFRNTALLNLLYNEIILENYESALEIFEICVNENIDFNKTKIGFLLRYKLGQLDENYVLMNYFENQLVNYSDIDTLKYIKKQLLIRNPKLTEQQIEDFYSICKESIENILPTNRTYIDKYNIEMDENSFCDSAEILTISKTKKIINIYVSKDKQKVKLRKND